MKLKTLYKVLIGCAILVPALILGIVGSVAIGNFYGKMMEGEIASSAYAAALKPSTFFSGYSMDVSAYSKIDLVRKAAGGDYGAISSEVDKFVASEVNANASLLDVVIMDGAGMVITASNESAKQKTFFAYDDPIVSLENDEVYVSPLYIDNEKYFDSIIVFTTPVETTSGSVGYVSAVVSATELFNSAASATFLGDGKLIFVDTNGNVVNYNGTAISHFENLVTTDLVSIVNAAKAGTNLTGNDKQFILKVGSDLATSCSVAGTDWRWVSLYPSPNISSVSVPIIIIGLVLMLILIAAEGALGLLLYKKTVAPIDNINKTLSSIRSGNVDERLPTKGNYEFEAIAGIFNSMLDDAFVSEEIHRTISELSNNMLFEWSLDDSVMYVSDNFKNMFDLDIESTNLLNGTFLDSLMDEDDAARYKHDFGYLLKTKEYMEGEYKVKTRNNAEIWICIRAKSVNNRLGDVLRIIGVVTDINNDKKLNIQLSQRASYDFLSQLYNRSTFMRELQNQLDLRRANENYAALFIDVDDFKFINDRYGHNVGDEVIRFVSDTAKDMLGERGFAGRFGGDEFVLCVTDSKLVSEIDDFAMAIIDRLYQGYKCDTAKVILNIKASIGISLSPEHSREANELVGAADEAMYFVKKNGKANYHIFNPDDVVTIDQENTVV